MGEIINQCRCPLSPQALIHIPNQIQTLNIVPLWVICVFLANCISGADVPWYAPLYSANSSSKLQHFNSLANSSYALAQKSTLEYVGYTGEWKIRSWRYPMVSELKHVTYNNFHINDLIYPTSPLQFYQIWIKIEYFYIHYTILKLFPIRKIFLSRPTRVMSVIYFVNDNTYYSRLQYIIPKLKNHVKYMYIIEAIFPNSGNTWTSYWPLQNDWIYRG